MATHRKAFYAVTLAVVLCGLDPIRDRKEIESRLLASRVDALLAYLKTL